MEGERARLAADLVLFVHFGYVMFVIAGLLLVWLGRWRRWSWVRDPWFRLGHLAAILVVAVSAWFRLDCPLTVLENDLRARSGDAGYAGSFMAHWVGEILFYQGPPWAFTLAYSVFGLLVIGSWFAVRPRRFR